MVTPLICNFFGNKFSVRNYKGNFDRAKPYKKLNDKAWEALEGWGEGGGVDGYMRACVCVCVCVERCMV